MFHIHLIVQNMKMKLSCVTEKGPRELRPEESFACDLFLLFTTSITFIKTLHECTLWSFSSLLTYPVLCNCWRSVPSCSIIWNNLCRIGIISYNLPVKPSVPEDFFVGRCLYYEFIFLNRYGTILVFYFFLALFW